MIYGWKDFALWAGGFAALVPLLFILLWKKRAKNFPILTAYLGFVVVESVTLFLAFKNQKLYAELYWAGQIGELVLQFGVVVEIARQVFRPFGRWAEGARTFWSAACGLSLIAATGLTFVADPSAPTSGWSWVIKANFFSIMLLCMISVAILVTARRYGLSPGSHVFGLAQGWTFWAFIAFFIQTCHSYFGFTSQYRSLEWIGEAGNVAVQVFWIYVFWKEEPSRVLTPERHNILIEQQRQLDYYVSKLVHRSGTRRIP